MYTSHIHIGIVRNWGEKQRQRSSRLFRGQNLFNSLLAVLLGRFRKIGWTRPFLPNRSRQNYVRLFSTFSTFRTFDFSMSKKKSRYVTASSNSPLHVIQTYTCTVYILYTVYCIHIVTIRVTFYATWLLMLHWVPRRLVSDAPCVQCTLYNAVVRIRNDLFRIRIQLWIFRVPDLDPDPGKSYGSLRIRTRIQPILIKDI